MQLLFDDWSLQRLEERHRRAVKAAQDKDAAGLWQVMEAHLDADGSRGVRVGPHTRRAYRTALRSFVAFAIAEDKNLLRLESDVWDRYVDYLFHCGAGTRPSPATQRVKLAGVRALYKALRWAGVTQADPFTHECSWIDPRPVPIRFQPYSEEELVLLLGKADVRMQALLLLCGHAGLRISQALTLAWADVDLVDRVLVIRTGKGGKTRRVNLSDALTDALKALGSRPGVVIGGSADAARERLEWLCKRADVKPKGYRALRHSAGTRLVRDGQSLKAVAQQLGHASIETTKVYARWANDGHKTF